MAMCLSFSESFFSGEEDDLYDVASAENPTSVLQAIVSLPDEQLVEIGRKVFGMSAKTAAFWAESESAPLDVLEHMRETDTCDGMESPVEVWIDDDGYYTLMIHESR